MDDKDAKSLFNGFEKVIADGELAEVRLEPNCPIHVILTQAMDIITSNM